VRRPLRQAQLIVEFIKKSFTVGDKGHRARLSKIREIAFAELRWRLKP
jgi:hypothetical protein